MTFRPDFLGRFLILGFVWVVLQDFLHCTGFCPDFSNDKFLFLINFWIFFLYKILSFNAI